jgi:NADH:ubiquinone oxidoreductase subunit C
MEQITSGLAEELASRFPEWLEMDTRENYSGVIIKKENLLDFARVLRDEIGFDYLASITAVDYYPEDLIEVVSVSRFGYRGRPAQFLLYPSCIPARTSRKGKSGI